MDGSGPRTAKVWELEKFSDAKNVYKTTVEIDSLCLDLELETERDRVMRVCPTIRGHSSKLHALLTFCIPVGSTKKKPEVVKKACDLEVGHKHRPIPLGLFPSTPIKEGWLEENGSLKIQVSVEYQSKTVDAGPSIAPLPVAPPPYVGLSNQGATCYMNSMLQALYHLPAFRELIYRMDPTSDKPDQDNIPLNLQVLFARMQLAKGTCSTKNLTKSFGWGDAESFMQHDVQEFCRVLLDNLEMKMKGTELEKGIPNLFRGRYRSYVRCTCVDYDTTREEDFYDLSMVVKDCPTLMKSFEKYIDTEELKGDNQYQTDKYGKQDAVMGTEFLEFPEVLHLHLRRFEFDFRLERMIKINSRFEFPEELDLEEFLADSADHSRPCVYSLFGVLVHSGTPDYGHYYAFLRPTIEQKWYEFNDSAVRCVDARDAIEANYGSDGSLPGQIGTRYYSAYMLVYVRKDRAAAIYDPSYSEQIPQRVLDYIAIEDERKRLRELERIERANTRKFKLVTDSDLKKLAYGLTFGIPKSDKISDEHSISINITHACEELYQKVAEKLALDEESFDLYHVSSRTIRTKIPCSGDQIEDYAPCREVGTLYVFDRRYEGDEDSDFIALIYGYFPEERRYPVAFCRPFLAMKNLPVSVIGDAFRDAYNKDDEEPIQIYQLSQSEVVQISKDKISSSFADLAITSGTTFVVQVSDPEIIQRMPSSSAEESEEEGDEPEICSFLTCNRFPLKFDAFIEISSENVVTVEFEGQRRKAKFSFNLDIDSVISFLLRHVFSHYYSKVNHDFDQPKCFVLYRPKDMRCLTGETLSAALKGKTLTKGNEFQLRFWEGISAGLVSMSYRIILWYSFDGFTTVRDRMPLLCHESITVAELKNLVFQSSYFEVDSPEDLRVCEIHKGLIFRTLKNDVVLRKVSNPFRIEVIPPEQKGLLPGSNRIVQIEMGKRLSEKFSLIRFLRAGETVGELKSWLAERFSKHIPSEFWESCSVEFKKRSSSFFVARMFLKDEDVIKDKIGDASFIYITQRQTTSLRRERDPDLSESVKIHN